MQGHFCKKNSLSGRYKEQRKHMYIHDVVYAHSCTIFLPKPKVKMPDSFNNAGKCSRIFLPLC